jgi:hypothetical protein
VLGIEQTYRGDDFAEWNDFSLAAADDEKAVTRGLHIGVAPSRGHADEFWRVGVAAGYRDGRRSWSAMRAVTRRHARAGLQCYARRRPGKAGESKCFSS